MNSAMPSKGRLLITRGLPGSGKTTMARHWVERDPGTRLRVNRDDLRLMLFGGLFGGWNPRGRDESGSTRQRREDLVTAGQHAMVRAFLVAGSDVVVDDTNLYPEHAAGWRDLAFSVGSMFGVLDLTDVSRKLCVARDHSRELAGQPHVGAEVIYGMWEKHIKGQPYPLPVPEPAGGVDQTKPNHPTMLP